MVIAVASGKGGTGKTTFAVNLAYALADGGKKTQLLDCDVEEPNDYLFVKPDFVKQHDVTVLKPVLDDNKCDGCGRCAEACNYNAIAVVKKKVLIFNELCHSCGLCTYVCPQGAFHEQEAKIGVVEEAAERNNLFFAHGKLNVGESLAPDVVEGVKQHIDADAVTIIDASPGTACPVVKAMEGADVAILVTEPTPFGLNDLKLAVGMSLKMGIPTGIVVNRSDGRDTIIEEYAQKVGVRIIGRIPFSRRYAETYSAGDILVRSHEELVDNLLNIYEEINTLIGMAVPPAPAVEEFDIIENTLDVLGKGNAQSYKELTVISGKGGTGKTTVTAAFAQLSKNKILADNDVDAADLHLLFSPVVREAHPFVGGKKAEIVSEKCTGCGRCAEACHFDAIRFDGPKNDMVNKTYRIEQFACEGCGLCPMVCPVKAIKAHEAVTGNWFDSTTSYGPMIHARLGIAEQNSGRLVAKVRNRASETARKLGMGKIINDGPPGTGCPVIASVSGTDIVIIVTEPTVSGVHDMERVLDLAGHFGIVSFVIINKFDINKKQTERIGEIAKGRGSRVIATIPFDSVVNEALMEGKTVVEFGDSPAVRAIRNAWDEVKKKLQNRTEIDRRGHDEKNYAQIKNSSSYRNRYRTRL